jgi:uncharacterized membrane protein
LALAVDVGLAYSIRKSAQSAADLAAMAGAQQAFGVIGTTYYSGTCPATAGCTGQKGAQEVSCVSSPPNPPVTSIDSACLYALKNGFVNNSSNNGYTQTVAVEAYTNASGKSPANAPGVTTSTNYWVYVEITEQIPHLFGGVFGASFLSVDVWAVAGIIPKTSTISLIQ